MNNNYEGETLFSTGLAASMAVNALMTGMIVFRILKVTGAMPSTSFEHTLGSNGGNKFWHIMFIIIESGMALLVIQVVRFVLAFMPETAAWFGAYDFVVAINQVLNVIFIRSVFFFYFFCVADNIYLARESHQRSFLCGFK